MSVPNDPVYNNSTYDPQPVPPFAASGSHPSPPQTVYLQQLPPEMSFGCSSVLFRFFSSVLSYGLLFVFLVFLMSTLAALGTLVTQSSGGLDEKLVAGREQATYKIAIIRIEGVILDADDSFVTKQIRQAEQDERVKGVILRIDSPGGSLSASDYYLYLLKKLKQDRRFPVVVSMGSVAASGGYYVAMIGDEIFAEPTTITGSIGVVVPQYKAIELFKKIGVESEPVTSGPMKTMGSLTRPTSPEEKKIWQDLVDEGFERFKKIIRDGRDVFREDPEKLDALATGQVYTANQALDHQLIDKIGYQDDAIDATLLRAGLDLQNAKVIRYKKKQAAIDALLESKTAAQGPSLKTINEMTTPRLYLLPPQMLPMYGE